MWVRATVTVEYCILSPPPTKVPKKIGFTIRERKIKIKKRAKAKPKELNKSNVL